MARPRGKSELLELIVEKRERLALLRDERDGMEKEFNSLTETFDQEMKAFKGLLSTWRALHSDKRADELWPDGFEDLDQFGDRVMWRPGSDVDAAMREIQESADPLHVDEVVRRAYERTGRKITKASLVSTLSRLAKTDREVFQVGPNTFALQWLHGPGGLYERQKAHRAKEAARAARKRVRRTKR